METKEAIKLSKQEALSIFCFLEISYSNVLEQKLEIIKNSRECSLLPDIKNLLLVVKIWKNYKSEKIRDIVQYTMELFIKAIYQSENRRLSMNNLKFILPLVFSFRKVRSQKAMKHTAHNEDYLRYFRNNFKALAPK
ncbi:MAG: hypothetical protein Q7U47_07625 [Paludibacter sp.]|nr:hypothetical protein [Paludibacter sp.]